MGIHYLLCVCAVLYHLNGLTACLSLDIHPHSVSCEGSRLALAWHILTLVFEVPNFSKSTLLTPCAIISLNHWKKVKRENLQQGLVSWRQEAFVLAAPSKVTVCFRQFPLCNLATTQSAVSHVTTCLQQFSLNAAVIVHNYYYIRHVSYKHFSG